MSWRGMAPITVVILLVGSVLVSTALAMAAIAIIATLRDVPVKIPQELATVCISSLTALGGLLTPNTGLVSGRTARRAEVAGHAAAAAVVEADLEADLDAAEAEGHDTGRHR